MSSLDDQVETALATGPNINRVRTLECVAPLTVENLFFIHERGFYMEYVLSTYIKLTKRAS
jgi:hypothetical protein